MNAPWIDNAFVTVESPFTVPFSFVALELVFTTCAVLTFLHAWRAWRRGDRSALFTWLTIVIYGLAMEVLSYNFVHSYEHGRFVLTFYRRQLPLYIVGLYPLLEYTAIATARRFRLRPAAEPFLVGLLIVCMDAPYDVLGARLGWWTWSDTDPNVAYRWLGVPVSVYYWYVAFGGILSALTRAVGARVTSPWRLALAFPVAVATIVLGVVSFLPFHVLKARGVADGTIVAALLAASVVVAALARKERTSERDAILFAIPLVVYGFELAVTLVLWPTGHRLLAADLGVVLLVAVVGLAAAVVSHPTVLASLRIR